MEIPGLVVQSNKSEQTSQTSQLPMTQTMTQTKSLTNSSSKSSTEHKDFGYVTKLPTVAQRGSAIAGMLEHVQGKEAYQKLAPEQRAKVRASLYDKYVVPAYSGAGKPVPDKKTWVDASEHFNIKDYYPTAEGAKLSETYKAGGATNFASDAIVGADKAVDKLTMFGLKVGNSYLNKVYGMEEYFSHKLGFPEPPLETKQVVQRGIDNAIDATRNHIQSDDFWLQTHPRDTMVGRLGSDTGEFVATLPLYEALGTEKLIQKPVQSLTTRLMSSKTGTFVANRIVNATDGFLASLATSGGDKKEGVAGAAAFAVFGAASEGAIKVASSPLIKGWTANLIAMGGKPFAQETMKSAATELEHGSFESTALALTRDREDPVMAAAHKGEKVALNSISMTKYKQTYTKLTKEQKLSVLGARWQQINHAADEAPVHLPSMQAAGVAREVKQHQKQLALSDPKALKSVQNILALTKLDPVAPVVQNDLAIISKETGISNSGYAQKRLTKTTREIENRSASLSPDEFIRNNQKTKVYLRAPQARKEFISALQEAGRGNWDKFYDTLKIADKSGFTYEKPEHRLLYFLANKKDLPASMVTALRYRLRQLEPYQGLGAAELDTRAKTLINKMQSIYKRGGVGNNIYASTDLTKPALTGTPWDKQLTEERIQKTIQANRKSLKNHPEALAGFESAIKTFNKKVFKAKTPEEFTQFMQALEGSVKSNTKNAKAGKSFTFER